MNNVTQSRVDILASELCDEIDFLSRSLAAEKAESKYWRDEYSKLLNSSISDNNKTIGVLLVHAIKPKNPNQLDNL